MTHTLESDEKTRRLHIYMMPGDWERVERLRQRNGMCSQSALVRMLLAWADRGAIKPPTAYERALAVQQSTPASSANAPLAVPEADAIR